MRAGGLGAVVVPGMGHATVTDGVHCGQAEQGASEQDKSGYPPSRGCSAGVHAAHGSRWSRLGLVEPGHAEHGDRVHYGFLQPAGWAPDLMARLRSTGGTVIP